MNRKVIESKLAANLVSIVEKMIEKNPALEVAQVEIAQVFLWLAENHSDTEESFLIADRMRKILIHGNVTTIGIIRTIKSEIQRITEETEQEHKLLIKAAKVKGHPEDYFLGKSLTVEQAIKQFIDSLQDEVDMDILAFIDTHGINLGTRGGAFEYQSAARQKMIRDLCQILPPDDETRVSTLIGGLVTKLLGGNPKTNKDTAQRILKTNR